jgi:hypothetical protein
VLARQPEDGGTDGEVGEFPGVPRSPAHSPAAALLAILGPAATGLALQRHRVLARSSMASLTGRAILWDLISIGASAGALIRIICARSLR